MPLPEPLVSAPVATKLAIDVPSSERVVHLCAVTFCYHSIKSSYRDKFLNYLQAGNVNEIARITIEVMSASLAKFRGMI